jgi:glycerate 2-kinase
MKIVIAPDSFKGSLTATKVGLTIRQAFLAELPHAQIEVVPMADGGEGTLETMLFATRGTEIRIKATGPLGEPVPTAYGVLGDQETVVIEMANVAGLPMVPKEKRDPMKTTTYGVGELLMHALDQGYRKFIIGIGGSATNDGGMGMLQALGVRFYDRQGALVSKKGGAALMQVASADFRSLDPRIRECDIRVASDVKNPLCGPNGATAVFGPQKGVTTEQIGILDQAMERYATVIEEQLSTSFRYTEGSGAAGGLGFALLVIGGKIQSGSQIIAEATGLAEKIKNADWVITGEGQSDFQTMYGKVPSYVAKLAKQNRAKALLLSGGLGKGFEALYEDFVSCHSIVHRPVPLEEAMEHAEDYLFLAARNLARLLKSCSA